MPLTGLGPGGTPQRRYGMFTRLVTTSDLDHGVLYADVFLSPVLRGTVSLAPVLMGTVSLTPEV